MSMKRLTGLLIVEVRNSNPNGDPDQDSQPRLRADGKGEISPVSVKRKLRDLVEQKDGPVWEHLKSEFPAEEFAILESRGRERKAIIEEVKTGKFVKKYWDARLFGSTFLEKEGTEQASFIRTGCAQFGVGVSVAPLELKAMTFTNKSGVQEGKDRGMAPMAFKVVEHGIYTIPFFINPSAAAKSGCTEQDVELMLRLLPLAYTHTRSLVRSQVEILSVHTFTHSNALGSVSDLRFIDSLTPKRKEDPTKPSVSIEEYDIPKWDAVKAAFDGKGTYKDYAMR